MVCDETERNVNGTLSYFTSNRSSCHNDFTSKTTVLFWKLQAANGYILLTICCDLSQRLLVAKGELQGGTGLNKNVS